MMDIGPTRADIARAVDLAYWTLGRRAKEVVLLVSSVLKRWSEPIYRVKLSNFVAPDGFVECQRCGCLCVVHGVKDDLTLATALARRVIGGARSSCDDLVPVVFDWLCPTCEHVMTLCMWHPDGYVPASEQLFDRVTV